MTRAPRRILLGSVQRELCADLVDGGVIDLADLRSKDGGATLYVPEIPWGRLERVLGSGDRILASASSPVEARLKCPGGGVLRVQEARGGWGLEDVADGWSAEELARFVGEAEDLLLEHGLPWALSASAVAAAVSYTHLSRAAQPRVARGPHQRGGGAWVARCGPGDPGA